MRKFFLLGVRATVTIAPVTIAPCLFYLSVDESNSTMLLKRFFIHTDSSAMFKTADSTEAVASCSSNSPGHSTEPTTPSRFGGRDNKEGLKATQESEPSEPPTKKKKVSEPQSDCSFTNRTEGMSDKKSPTLDTHEEASFEVRSLPSTEAASEEKKEEVRKVTDNAESEDSSDSGSTTSSSSSENEKASAPRDSSKQQSDFYKSTKALQPTMVDMLRRSTSELLKCLQRYYGSK